MGQNDGVKKLRELRKEIAQIKTVARERELGVRGATHELVRLRRPVKKRRPQKDREVGHGQDQRKEEH